MGLTLVGREAARTASRIRPNALKLSLHFRIATSRFIQARFELVHRTCQGCLWVASFRCRGCRVLPLISVAELSKTERASDRERARESGRADECKSGNHHAVKHTSCEGVVTAADRQPAAPAACRPANSNGCAPVMFSKAGTVIVDRDVWSAQSSTEGIALGRHRSRRLSQSLTGPG